MPDIRRSLDVLADAWSLCQGCELGVRRHEVGGSFVFGEGTRGGIMLVGEGPGLPEEKEGRPFIGKSGMLLRHMLEHAGLTDYYMTNTVACRSCSPAFDSIGRQLMFKDWKSGLQVPRINDEPPTPKQMATCSPRLFEQIYMVDPVLLISLGPAAANALTGRHISLTKEHGTIREVEVPGAWKLPVLTEKKKQWYRKVSGQMIAPVVDNMVRYNVLMTFHPAFALRYVEDRRDRTLFMSFVLDIQTAINTYRRYIHELTDTQKSDDIVLDVAEIESYANEL